MVSKSYSNLLDLSSSSLPHKRFPSLIPPPPPGMFGEPLADDGANSFSSSSDFLSPSPPYRIIVVAHFLPLHAHRRPDNSGWSFTWDRDALLLQLKDGIPDHMDVVYVGCLGVHVDPREQEDVSATLLEKFKCVPAFLPPDLKERFYLGFCKQQLWPLFHYMLPLVPDHGGRFDRSLWQAYVTVNRVFADKIMEVISADDFVWVHDYHLMVLPTFLRNKFNKIKLGFFLHSPFPSSEVFRTLPVREEIIRGLLNADLVGFHTFDYARHFLSCCSRMLGLDYESKRGYISLDYYGRTVGVKIMPVGIHMGQLEDGLKLPDTFKRVKELREEFEGKIVLLGVDDMDIFKGISLKLLAMEELLRQNPKWRGKVVLVQIANPARGRGKDVQELQVEAEAAVSRINEEYGFEGYKPVILIEERKLPLFERIAYYSIAECCIVTAVRDGMNLIPYEYIVCRQSAPDLDAMLGVCEGAAAKKSMLIVSEFIGCSPSLSGAVRVNPWNIEAVAEAMNLAIIMPEAEKQMRHEKHYKYVSTHDVAYWAQSCVGDLERACKNHSQWLCYGLGFGLSFRVVALDPHFQKLLLDEHIISAYKNAKSRAIFLDYDGTMVPQGSINKAPSQEVLAVLDKLCKDSRNMVFIVSGRGRDPLSGWFSSCDNLGIAAEHGFFYRWNNDAEWKMAVPVSDFSWQDVVSPVLNLYTESTDGSYIESKDSALVWHYQDADPDFGSWQAKELLDHLESVLANEPVSVKSGQQIIEVKPQGISKGVIVEKLLFTLAERGMAPDFVLCVGDDRSDEDMFESIEAAMSLPPQIQTAEVFACTVGRKPSKAKYFLDDTVEVLRLLGGIATASDPVRGNWTGSLRIEDV